MKINGMANLVALSAVIALCGCAMNPAPSVSWENSDIHTVSVMMSEPIMRVDGSSHELLDSYYLTPLMTDNKVVMAPLDDIFDELNGHVTFEGDIVRYQLNGFTVTMTIGSTEATVNGVPVTAPAAPQRVDGAFYVPFKFVFESLGGKYQWNSARKLAEVSILRPTDAMFQYRKGDYSIKTIYKQTADWFGTEEAGAVADAMVANQNEDGGWFKLGSSDDLTQIYDRERFPTYRQKSSIDNDATYVQLTTLAKVYSKTGVEAYKDSFLKGVEFLLSGQYSNGGWPQFFPVSTGYHHHITLNDNAMANILTVLKDVTLQQGDYAFIPEDVSARAQTAVDKGIKLLLDTQVVVNGQKTGWCAQYTADTLDCTRGRSYELAAISGGASVNVIRFLMNLKDPSPEVIDAVDSAIAFLISQRIENQKLVDIKDDSLFYGKDRILMEKEGSDLWPRFIEIDTLRPLFSNRQGEKLYNYNDITYERRVGYRWLVGSPQKMIEQEYPMWQAKYSPLYTALD